MSPTPVLDRPEVPPPPPPEPPTRWGTVVAVILLAALAFTVSGVFPLRQLVVRNREVAATRAERDALVEENARLAEEVRRLQGDAEVERLARDRYAMVYPGETGYVVVPLPGDDEAPPVSEAEPTAAPSPWWQRLWDWLTGQDLVGDG